MLWVVYRVITMAIPGLGYEENTSFWRQVVTRLLKHVEQSEGRKW